MKLFIKKHVYLKPENSKEIMELYRSLSINYPKFFKMDNLSKLGFIASEILFNGKKKILIPDNQRENVAVICFNRSSSLETDLLFQKTIADSENFFPSPSLFVYTLPNIVTGEIAIRNGFCGETSFYICENFDEKMFFQTVKNVFSDNFTNFALCAWIESFANFHEVFMMLVSKEKSDVIFDEINIKTLYNNKL